MKKRNIIILVMFLTIGFAALSTSLDISGKLNIGFDSNDFLSSVIFTYANTETGVKAEITDDGKKIDFETERIENVDQTSTLEFDITNKSRQYDASVIISCGINEEFKSFEDYISIDNSLESPFELVSGDTKTGIVSVKQNQANSESLNSEIKFTCTLEVIPKERETLGDEIPVGPPEINVLVMGDEIQQELPINLTAIVNSNNKQVDNAKWILNNDSSLLGLDEDLYEGGLSDENDIDLEITTPGTYYLHVFTKEKRTPQETVIGPITVQANYHKHVDNNGVIRESNYQSDSSGGCFTKSNIVYEQIKHETHCDGKAEAGLFPGYESWGYAYRCNKCGYFFGHTIPSICPTIRTTYEQKDTGKRYYTTNCEKSNDTIENYSVSY